ncbi:MAG: sensor histidine kinase [Lachnospiraceae bacterium]|nr:sensor histidine kinase [Lachnospiraceae bacterium]
MKKLFRKIKAIYNSLPLESKIRSAYALIMIPMVIFLIVCLINIWVINKRYGTLIEAAGIASEFSLDFKKDFDYETYLLVVENKTIEESTLDSLLSDANRIVGNLEMMDSGSDNVSRLKSIKKYLSNLETYKSRIEENLQKGNLYEKNVEIWENDVQIVTELLRESMTQYIYYEIQNMEASRVSYQSFYMKIIIIMFVAFLIIVTIIALLSYYIPLSITRPIKKLSEVSDQVAKGDLSVRADSSSYAGSEIEILGDSLNAMIDKVDELLKQVTKEQMSLRHAELELLQAQINPHFLYNTLDTIVWLAEAGQKEKVVSMVENLSNFFRTSLNQGKDIISLSEELVHAGSYLKIQQVRYQDILSYEINVNENIDSVKIPKITLQPIVENALYHGIKNKRGMGTIKIDVDKEDDNCIITISDNGIGMSAERLEEVKLALKKSNPQLANIYGVFNVNERIRLNFGDEYGLNIDSAYSEGTRVVVKLPMYADLKEE